MPKLKADGDLTLARLEVSTLRALVYQYGLKCATQGASSEDAKLMMRRVRSLLPVDDLGGDDS